MKKIKKYILAITAIAFVLAACDKIDEPYLEEVGGTGPGPGPGDKVRKVLLEEFTGHKCPNCPEGTSLAHDLQLQYGEQLILISVHAGGFSTPEDAPYDADYRTQAGTDLANNFQVQFYPSGMINRTNYNGFPVMPISFWQDAIEEIIHEAPDVYITIESNYSDTDRKLTATVNTEILNDLTGNYNLSFFIVESKIVSAQKNDDENYGPVPDILDYEHNHLLRGAVSGTWGVELATGGVSSGEEISKDFNVTLDQDWDENNISVIAIVFDTDSEEVLQVEEHHIVE
jgi:hypothetical protein